MELIERKITSMLVNYEATLRAKLEKLPKNTVIVVDQKYKDDYVEAILKGVRDGVIWSIKNKEIF